jgi:hypothetical protein
MLYKVLVPEGESSQTLDEMALKIAIIKAGVKINFQQAVAKPNGPIENVIWTLHEDADIMFRVPETDRSQLPEVHMNL